MRSFLLLLPVVSLAACGSGYYWRSGEYREFHSPEGNSRKARNLDRQKIYYSVDRGEWKFLGVLEKNDIHLEGVQDARIHYIIYDHHHRKVGFISEEGELYRYDATGRLDSMGEFPILVKGLKVFFGFPLFSRGVEYLIKLNPIDPYGDF